MQAISSAALEEVTSRLRDKKLLVRKAAADNLMKVFRFVREAIFLQYMASAQSSVSKLQKLSMMTPPSDTNAADSARATDAESKTAASLLGVYA